jgi:transposase
VREVSADKGYSSVYSHIVINSHGATPLIAFKNNANGVRGGAFGRAFHYYSLHREEFLQRHHRRSNVEPTMSMIKAKFRDDVRSRTDTAPTNEVLCKVLAQNICC